MPDSSPTARVDGLMPPDRTAPGSVSLYPGQVWSVGRRDSAYLSASPDLRSWHLAVPGARPDLSVNQLELRVGTVGVAVTSQRDAGLMVDGVVSS